MSSSGALDMHEVRSIDVELRPGLGALAGVMAVLHARAADVAGMTYSCSGGRARLILKICASSEAAARLGLLIDRRADVLAVCLPPGATR